MRPPVTDHEEFTFAVGQRVWGFDTNRRVYDRTPGVYSGPIYEKHFEAYYIFAIEDRSRG